MFHLIDRIVAADDETVKRLGEDARKRAQGGTGQYALNQELIADACDRELMLRKAKREREGGVIND